MAQSNENIDLFMMFVISSLKLDVNYNGDDERLKLYVLCEKNPIFITLDGKKILSKIEDTNEPFHGKNYSSLHIPFI